MKRLCYLPSDEYRELKIIEENRDDIPQPESFAVLLEIKACALEPMSKHLLNSLFAKRPQVSYPLGCDVAGVVVAVGDGVLSLQAGDRVVGILPLDSEYSGCADYCVASEFDLVNLSDSIDFEVAAACIGDGLTAYTAVHVLAHGRRGESLLVTHPLCPVGRLTCQLAKASGLKVMAVSYSAQDHGQLKDANIDIIEADDKGNFAVNAVLEETGGLGVDIIIANEIRVFRIAEDESHVSESVAKAPHKHELISCLAVGGRLVISNPSFQLDPADSELLHMRGASLCFLSPHAATLSSAHTGRRLHILKDTMAKLASGELDPLISKRVTLSQVEDYLKVLSTHSRAKVVMRN